MAHLARVLDFFQGGGGAHVGDADFDRLFLQCLLDDAEAQEASIWQLGRDGFLRLRSGTNVTSEALADTKLKVDHALSQSEGITGAAVLARQAIAVFDAKEMPQHDPRVDERIGFRTRAMISAPIVFADRVWGAVNILNPRSGRPFPQEWKIFLTVAATLYGAAMTLAGQGNPDVVDSDSKSRQLPPTTTTTGKTTIVGVSPAIRQALAMCVRIANSDVPVLVLGETGTGKELVARRIHEESPRAHGPMIAINCAALPDNLLESELFGHVKGAFTGAERDRQGRFAAAAGGTLFLDEIADMSLACQAKLLRVLQEKRAVPLGSDKEYACDVRIVAATNRDLWAEVRHARFREDLYFRIAGIEIHLPPLRERQEDIAILIRYFLAEEAVDSNRPQPLTIAPDALKALMAFPWPGNVRQLRETLRAAAAVCCTDRIEISDLPVSIRKAVREVLSSSPATVASPVGGDSGERARYLNALETTKYLGTGRYNITAAARQLGMPRKTLAYQLRKMGIA